MRAASIVPSFNGIKVCSMTRTVFGKVETIIADHSMAAVCRRAAASEQITGEHAVLRDVLVHQAQDQGIEAVRPGAGRDDYDQHKGIKCFRQIEPIIDAISSIDRLVEFDSLPPGRGKSDDDDEKQDKRGEW